MHAAVSSKPLQDAQLLHMSHLTGITRTQIANVATQAHGPFLLHLHAHDRIRILNALASLYSRLDFKRKEAYVLRELLSVLMDLIVCGRQEGPMAMNRLSNHLDQKGLLPKPLNTGDVAVRAPENAAGNSSIVTLMRYVCDIYGVRMGSVAVSEDPSKPTTAEPSDEPKSEPFGWPELQAGVVREAVAIAEALPGLHSHVFQALS